MRDMQKAMGPWGKKISPAGWVSQSWLQREASIYVDFEEWVQEGPGDDQLWKEDVVKVLEAGSALCLSKYFGFIGP